MLAREIVEKFGGQSALAGMLDKGQSTIAYWVKTGHIPAKWHGMLLTLAGQHGIELSPEDFLSAGIKNRQAGSKANENKKLVAILPSSMAAEPAPPAAQGTLELGIEKQTEIDGVGMGVLSDGTAFLTGRGLARLCGVAHSVVQAISTEWWSEDSFPRSKKIREIVRSHGGKFDLPFIEITQRSGVFYAYPDSICLAVLEYYSFDAGPNIREEAKRNYRLLAGKALRDFIYTQVGYDPNQSVPALWRQFHDRVSLTYNSVPQGYFGVFKEIADMIVTLGQAGLHIDSKFVPDISVGLAWSLHWKNKGLNGVFGERIKFQHNYPSYFPQAESNPQEPWCYPEHALGEFRRWFREEYIGGGKFKNYIDSKVRERALPVSFSQIAISAYVRD